MALKRFRTRHTHLLAGLFAVFVTAALAQSPTPEWPQVGLNNAESHFSPLKQIGASNVKRLGLAWAADLQSYAGQIEGNPILVDGVLYVTTPWSVAMAVDARTGQVKWRYNPKISPVPFVTDEHGVKQRRGPALCCGPVNRGVAYDQGKVFLGTLDNRLVALNAGTGKEIWTTAVASPQDDYSITGAPRVIKGKVIIGNGGAEYGVRGFVAAFDADTGKQAWRFWIVPGDPTLPFENKAMEAAAKTWTGPYWKYGGGGTPWDGMAYDPELDLLYIGTGNGSPWPRVLRSPGGGDNLYLASILALRPETGEYVWHFQETPKDSFDYASTQPLVLADLTIDGHVRKVIMHAPKNGFFYTVDRTNGQFISGAAVAKVTWASGLDPKTGRPIETPAASYGPLQPDGSGGTRLSPAPEGGHSWHAMAWNPSLGLMYIPVQDTSGVYSYDPDFQYQVGRLNTGRLRGTTQAAGALTWNGAIGSSAAMQEGSSLLAWDPIKQKARWRVRFEKLGTTGGALATAGNLVFHGSNDGSFSAYAADTGKKLWSVMIAPGFANPVSYEIDGKQYVTVMTGRGGPDAPGRIYAFALDARTPMPSMEAKAVSGDVSGAALMAAAAQREFTRLGLPDAPGRQLLQQLCSGCHAPSVVGRLHESEAGWRQTIAEMSSRGAPGTPAQRDAIAGYLAQHLGPVK